MNSQKGNYAMLVKVIDTANAIEITVQHYRGRRLGVFLFNPAGVGLDSMETLHRTLCDVIIRSIPFGIGIVLKLIVLLRRLRLPFSITEVGGWSIFVQPCWGWFG